MKSSQLLRRRDNKITILENLTQINNAKMRSNHGSFPSFQIRCFETHLLIFRTSEKGGRAVEKGLFVVSVLTPHFRVNEEKIQSVKGSRKTGRRSGPSNLVFLIKIELIQCKQFMEAPPNTNQV